MPEIAANRKLSTLSTRNRAARLEEIFEEKTKLEWTEKLEKIAKKREETRELRSKEIEQIRGIVEAKKRLLAERAKIRDEVEWALSERKTKKLREVSGKPWKVLGHREATFGLRVVLKDKEGGTEVVYSTKQLAKLVENTRELFFSEKDRFARELFFCGKPEAKARNPSAANQIVLQRGRERNLLEPDRHRQTQTLKSWRNFKKNKEMQGNFLQNTKWKTSNRKSCTPVPSRNPKTGKRQ